VLRVLHVGVDRRCDDDDLALARRGRSSVEHADDVVGAWHAHDQDLARAHDAVGCAAIGGACSTAMSIGTRPRDVTVTSCPESMMWRVMGNPIAPKPMNPMFMRLR